jgi:hypothetical protein
MNGPNSDINRQQVLREMPSAPRDAFKATVLWSMLGAFGGESGFPAKQRVSAPGPLASSVRCFCRHEACTGRLCHCRELGRACQCGFSHRKSVLISSRPRQCTPCRAHARFLGDRKKSGLAGVGLHRPRGSKRHASGSQRTTFQARQQLTHLQTDARTLLF